jgi:hypothetical protein
MPIKTDDNRDISAQIVINLGCTKLPNGKTLREQLTIEGVSLWDVMTPSMALYYVPFSISCNEGSKSVLKKIRPYWTYAKHRFINYITRIRNMISRNEGILEESSFMFMGFNNYMYNDVLAPLAEKLDHDYEKKIIVLNDGVHSKKSNLHSNYIQFNSTWQYWNIDASREARIFKNKTDLSISELNKILKLTNFCFNNEYSQKIIDHAFHWLFHFDLPLLVNQVVLARNIIKRCKPSLLISSDVADIRCRVFTLLAHQKNIPTLELQYGSCEKSSYEWQFLLADHIAVWGQRSREHLLKQGVVDAQMTVTGTARNDSLVRVNSSLIQKTKNQLDIPNDSVVILFASTYQQKEYASFSNSDLMKKAIFNAANKMDGLKLIVKPHPLENVDEARNMLTSEKNIIFTDSNVDIRNLISACDVFIGLGTTATIDAMIAKKLIICPVFGDWIWSDWILESESTLVPRSEKEIEEIFINILRSSVEKIKVSFQPAQEKFINEMVYKPDGFSSKRISQLAHKLAKK